MAKSNSKEDAEVALIEAAQRRREVLLCRNDPLRFFKRYLSHHFTKPFGPAQLELIGTMERTKSTGARIARAEPREFGKTTIVGVGKILKAIAFKEKNFILYICDSKAQAGDVVDAIRSELEENEEFREDFGDLVTRERWGKFDIITANGVRLLAMGAKSRMRGRKQKQHRPDLMILDDLENDKNTETIELRDALNRWLNRVAMNMISETGDILYVGTILHWDSLLFRVLQDKAWDRMTWAAIDKQGNPTWDARWSLEKLAKKKSEIGSEAFASEFQNDPVDMASQAFKSSFKRTYKYSELMTAEGDIKPMVNFLTLDPAYSGKKTSHYTAMVVVSVDGENNWYVRDIFRERASELEVVNKFMELASKWGVAKAGVETVFLQKNFMTSIKAEMQRRNQYFEIVDLKANVAEKTLRIRSLVPRWELGTIFLPEEHEKYKLLLDELLQFPKGTSDDIIDALAYHVQIAYPAAAKVDLEREGTEHIYQDTDENGYGMAVGLSPQQAYASMIFSGSGKLGGDRFLN